MSNDKILNNPADDSISDLSFSSQADHMAVASWDSKVRIYEITSTGDPQGRALYEHGGPVLSAQWFPDGSKVVSGGCDNAVKVYDLGSSQAMQIGSHDAPVQSVRAVTVNGSSIIASSSWDKTLKYWDIRQAPNVPVCTVQLPDRSYSMDAKKDLLVVATANKHISIVNLNNPQTIFKTVQSPLKWQTRVVSCYIQANGFAVGSIEGRCGIMYVDDDDQKKVGYCYRCHREDTGRNESNLYSVNSIAFHPTYGTYATAGSDGSFHIWDKDYKSRLRGSSTVGGTIPVTSFNRNGNIFAYAISYDWSKGHSFNTPQYTNVIKLHPVQDEEVKPRPRKK